MNKLHLLASVALLPAVTPTATKTAAVAPAPKPSTAPTTPAGAPTTSAPPANPAPADPDPGLTSPIAVVTQFYQDITDGNYASAWSLGGDNIGGQTYTAWVAGYQDTTASISISSYGSFSSDSVWAQISAVQLNGSVNAYYGTYTIQNGVIVSADIAETS